MSCKHRKQFLSLWLWGEPFMNSGTSLIPWLLSICESLADKSFIIRSLLTLLAVTSQSFGARSKDNKASCNKYFWFWKDLFQNCCFYWLEFWLPRDFIMMWILSASKYFHIASFHVLRICGRWKIIKKTQFSQSYRIVQPETSASCRHSWNYPTSFFALSKPEYI